MFHQHHAATRAVLARIPPALHTVHLPPTHQVLSPHPVRHAAARVASAHRCAPPAPAAVVQRVRHEYAEWPTLSLTVPQARRLFGLDQPMCMRVLQSCVHTGLLCRTSDGRFCRRDLVQ